MRRKNIIGALMLITFAIAYGAMTAQLPARTLPNTPDPSFFPWVNTIIILVLSISLLVRSLRCPIEVAVPADTGERRKVILALCTFVAYVIAMPRTGFVLATLPFFAAMMLLFGERRPAYVCGGALAATVVLYILFRHGFGVFLPRGLLAGIIA
ncbi:MAG: tripartite tricarboxylate transporter TctB family protein [Hyphomicrobiaceae bacterium]